MIRFALLVSLLLPSLSTGCGDNDEGSPDGGVVGFQEFIAMDWTLEAGTEGYFCKTVTLTEDVYVHGYRAMFPPGTHHVGLHMLTEPAEPDAEFPCSFAVFADSFLYANGVGTEEIEFPEGVGVRLPKGKQLFLNLHVVNTGDQPLSGRSGTEAFIVPSVEQEAEAVFFTDIDMNIPPLTDGHEETMTCSMKEPATIFAWLPHMHALGVHMTVTLNDEVIHDEDFNWEQQHYYPGSVPVQAGDELKVTCVYDNPTERRVSFNVGYSNDEMCFFVFLRYPPLPEWWCDQPF